MIPWVAETYSAHIIFCRYIFYSGFAYQTHSIRLDKGTSFSHQCVIKSDSAWSSGLALPMKYLLYKQWVKALFVWRYVIADTKWRTFWEMILLFILYPGVDELQKDFVTGFLSFGIVGLWFCECWVWGEERGESFACNAAEVLTLRFVFKVEIKCVMLHVSVYM